MQWEPPDRRPQVETQDTAGLARFRAVFFSRFHGKDDITKH